MKRILITGASSGIGEEMAVQYAAPSIAMFLCGRDAERLQIAAEKCRSKGAVVTTKIMDVSDRRAMAEWIGGISREAPLDLIIANAGISGGFSGRAIEDIAADYRIFDVNLYGVLNTIYPALPAMIAQQGGQIVILSSLASFVPMPSAPAYSASKVAVRFYGESLAAKLKPHGVAVSIICPGFIKSSMTDSNDFPMPFLMETKRAVGRMIKGIERREMFIQFPWVMVFGLKLLSILPSRLIRVFLAYLPDKKPLPKL